MTLRWRGASILVRPAAVAVPILLLGLAVALAVASLAVGRRVVPLPTVMAVLDGGGTRIERFLVLDQRLPRAVTALFVGAAFGTSGAILQRLARNPLASPDVIGVNAGAATAATFVLIALQGSRLQVATAGLAGAVLAGAVVFGLARRRGTHGLRFVLVGIGVSAMLTSVTQYLLTRAQIQDARRASVWLVGSLGSRDWGHAVPVALAVAVLVPLAACATRELRTLEMGDDVARGLGVPVERLRAALLAAAILLAAFATAAAGPVAFVALVTPQIAVRISRLPVPPLIGSAACGAALLVASDLVAANALPVEMPVGVVTGAVGGPFLLALLVHRARAGLVT